MAIKILNDLLPIAEQTEVGVVKPDNVSITITETGELQSSVVDLPEDVVTAENYDNPKLWKGTLEEYNAIETKDPLVTYIITDDNVETLKTTDYNALSNKPSINDITLEGNKTLEELNIQAADTSLTTSQITNCITKIPQDIKLELTDGTLTLKAGSKVYKGDGTVVNITNDISSTNGGTSTGFKLLFTSGTGFGAYLLEQCISSDTSPGAGYQIWFNTSDKIIYRDDSKTGNFVATNWALPIARITTSDGVITSIDQVFNGFGYIGSTTFALPGIEGLIPNGKNEDGSLNNTKFTITNVLTSTKDSSWTQTQVQLINGNILDGYADYDIYYDSESNYNVAVNNPKVSRCVFGIANLVNGRITSFSPKTTFQAVDRNELDTYDYVVEQGVTNGITWEKWKSGKLIQRGSIITSQNATITFPKPYANTDYAAFMTPRRTDNAVTPICAIQNTTFSSTSMVVLAGSFTASLSWMTIGQGA